jgi:hypothetical protein
MERVGAHFEIPTHRARFASTILLLGGDEQIRRWMKRFTHRRDVGAYIRVNGSTHSGDFVLREDGRRLEESIPHFRSSSGRGNARAVSE